MDQWTLVSFYHFLGRYGREKRPGDEVSLCPLLSPVSFVSLMFPVSLVSPVSCVPCPLYPLCPLCSLCPVVFRVSPVLCVPFPRVPCVPFAISKKWNVRWRCPCFMWHVARKLRWFSLLSYDNMLVFFFRTRRRSKDVIFHENRK